MQLQLEPMIDVKQKQHEIFEEIRTVLPEDDIQNFILDRLMGRVRVSVNRVEVGREAVDLMLEKAIARIA